MRTNFDFAPFRRSTVGFDQLFDLMERGASTAPNEGYPPFDLEQEGDDRYRITLAVAGFKAEEIDITAQRNQLVIAGKRRDAEDGRFIHRGIAARSFERRFALGDFVKVKEADLRDGLLSIILEREVPEEMKPHKIRISSPDGAMIEGRKSVTPSGDNENSRKEEAA